MELFEVGTEAETCLMPGRGMNGLRGVIVCYNANYERYTLELDSGEMLSVRIRNVKAVAANNSENVSVSEDQGGDDEDSKPSIVMVETVKKGEQELLPKKPSTTTVNTTSKAAATKSNSSLPKGRRTHQEPSEDVAWEERNPQKKELNIIDRICFSIGDLISNLSPSVILVMVLAIVVSHKMFWADSSDHDAHHPRYYYPHRSWYWYWPIGIYSIGGLFSFLVVCFFVYQWGTAKGQLSFRWDRVKYRALNMDFWEAMRIFALLEGAFYFLMNVAGGSRRRRN